MIGSLQNNLNEFSVKMEQIKKEAATIRTISSIDEEKLSDRELDELITQAMQCRPNEEPDAGASAERSLEEIKDLLPDVDSKVAPHTRTNSTALASGDAFPMSHRPIFQNQLLSPRAERDAADTSLIAGGRFSVGDTQSARIGPFVAAGRFTEPKNSFSTRLASDFAVRPSAAGFEYGVPHGELNTSRLQAFDFLKKLRSGPIQASSPGVAAGIAGTGGSGYESRNGEEGGKRGKLAGESSLLVGAHVDTLVH